MGIALIKPACSVPDTLRPPELARTCGAIRGVGVGLILSFFLTAWYWSHGDEKDKQERKTSVAVMIFLVVFFGTIALSVWSAQAQAKGGIEQMNVMKGYGLSPEQALIQMQTNENARAQASATSGIGASLLLSNLHND